ncbi:MAG: type II secretion system F family protein [Proteobacteria bacterium]|nr:type II secretion system F family protein [Pseudomonadota bacterium]
MPTYSWQGKNRAGRVIKGKIDAKNVDEVYKYLAQQLITPIKVEESKEKVKSAKVPIKDIVIFTRQFSTMIDAGLPLVQSLDILAAQQPIKAFKEVLLAVKNDVEQGTTLADALKKHPKVFDDLYVGLVAAGEMGGMLDTILNRLATYMEKAEKLKKRVKGALTYPIAVIGIAVIVVAVILIWVIPVFQKMFADFGGELPAPTQFVINLSQGLKKYGIFIVIGFFVLSSVIKKYYGTPKGRRKIDALLLKVPVFSDIIRKSSVARFTRTLGTMIQSGVQILDAMDIVAKTAGNKIVEDAIVNAKVSISQGKTIAEPIGESGVFPPMVVQMIAVGEATGAMDTMLNKIADFYEEEVDAAVDALTALLEPMLMVGLGSILGGLIISMYLPIFKLAGAAGG